jgi:pimeloyl-ACP methyl ester carboxylesterase
VDRVLASSRRIATTLPRPSAPRLIDVSDCSGDPVHRRARRPPPAQGIAHRSLERPAEVDPVLLSGDPERMLPYLASLEWAAENRSFLAARNAWLLAHPVPPYARQLHYLASEGHDAWDQLPQITAPTLVIHGSDDGMNLVANGRLLAERIPGAELHIIPGARHVYFWDHAEEASRVVRAFLERHPLPG